MAQPSAQRTTLPPPNPAAWLVRAVMIGSAAAALPVAAVALGPASADTGLLAMCSAAVVVVLAVVGVLPLLSTPKDDHGLMLRVLGGSMLRVFACIVGVLSLQFAVAPPVVAFMLSGFLAWVAMTAADTRAFSASCNRTDASAQSISSGPAPRSAPLNA